MTKPIIGWYDSSHIGQLPTPVDFGVIDAGDESNVITVNIWNNKGGLEDISKMEECKITVRDLDGGLGDAVGKIVQSVRDNWFHAQVDSLGETDLTESTSRIGASYSKTLGTLGSTIHRKSQSATTWAASTAYTVGQAVKPATANGKFYICTKAGTSGASAPSWSTIEDETVVDGSAEWIVKTISNKPKIGEILGLANDGTPANGGGNFTTVTFQAQVPLSADAGRQRVKLRCSFKYQ